MLKKAEFLWLAVGVGLKPTKRGARLKELLLMEEILHQLKLRLVVYPIIYKVLYIPGRAGISSINSITSFHLPYHIEEVLGEKFCWTVEPVDCPYFSYTSPEKHKTRNLTTQNKINWVLFLWLDSWFQEARDLHWDRHVLAKTRVAHCLGHGLCQTCWSMIDSWCHSDRSQWLHWFMLEVLWPCEWYVFS